MELGGPDAIGSVIFGVSRGTECSTLQVEDCWVPGPESHKYLFTVGAMGVLQVAVDGHVIAIGRGHPLNSLARCHLNVGQSNAPDTYFFGHIQRIMVWDHEVDCCAADLMYAGEVESAYRQFTQWFSEDLAVYSFGSLASYAAAAQEDQLFAADLLLKVDVHDELDGYDDFVCVALSKHGLSLTLGGPGRSWCRFGGGWVPVDTQCAVLDNAQARADMPWALHGSFCGDQYRHFGTVASTTIRSAWCRSRRVPGRRRPRQHRLCSFRDKMDTPLLEVSRDCLDLSATHGCGKQRLVSLASEFEWIPDKMAGDHIPSLEDLLRDLDQVTD